MLETFLFPEAPLSTREISPTMSQVLVRFAPPLLIFTLTDHQGACGVTSSNSDSIVAISHITFDAVSTSANPNANPLCGRRLRATRGGKSVDLTVVDRCVGCQPTDLDVTVNTFSELADTALGRVTVSWAWL